MHQSRDPQTQAAARTADSRVLSVTETVTYIDDHYHSGIPHLVSERSVRRYLSIGHWPCTRTASGRLGITVGDLREIWTWKPDKTRAW